MTDWKNAPLYRALLEFLPAYVSADDDGQGRTINVQKLRAPMGGMSHEGIYKWLRQGKLKPHQAIAFHRATETPENVAALARVGTETPDITAFIPFLVDQYASIFEMLEKAGHTKDELRHHFVSIA